MAGKSRVAHWIVAVGMVAGAVLPGWTQDVTKVSPEHNKVLFENEHVRVIEKTLAPGDKDAMHMDRSGWYYVNKPVVLRVEFEDGEVEMWEARERLQGWLEANAPHTYENIGKTKIEMTLVEVKRATKTAANSATNTQK